jgi:hypothetical protein
MHRVPEGAADRKQYRAEFQGPDLVRCHFLLSQSANLELALGHQLDYIELHYYRVRIPSFEAQPNSLVERF